MIHSSPASGYHNRPFACTTLLNAGKGEIAWPEPFVERITACAGELTHCDEADIKDGNGTKTGTVEIIARLQTKCLEFE